MHLKKIWISPDTGKKSRYHLRIWGGILGIVALMLLLIWGGMWLAMSLGWPREIFSLVLCLGVTALAVYLALRVGWRSVRDAVAFFLTEDGRLYTLDARGLSGHAHGIVSYARVTAETQKFLRKLAERPFLPAAAVEILKVERIRENGTYYAVRCQIRRPNRRAVRHTCFLVKGYGEEDLLLRELERRESWENAPEIAFSRNPYYILVSALVLAVFAVLCVLSHPAVGKLPEKIYFPCLGAAFVAVFCVVIFVVRHRRGE